MPMRLLGYPHLLHAYIVLIGRGMLDVVSHTCCSSLGLFLDGENFICMSMTSSTRYERAGSREADV